MSNDLMVTDAVSVEAELISAICKNKDMSDIITQNVDELFVSHVDVWDGLKSYYAKYRAVPDISVLQERYTDLKICETNNPSQYYLDSLKNSFIKTNLQQTLLKANRELKTDAPARVVERIQADITKLARLTNSVKDLDVTDFTAAEKHYAAVRERSAAMGGAPGILTGIKAIDTAYPTGLAGGHMIVMIGWPGRAKSWLAEYLACAAWSQGHKPLIISMEMSTDGVRDRIYTLLGSGIFQMSDFQKGSINPDDFHEWGKKMFDGKVPFPIVSNEGHGQFTPMHIQGKIDQYQPSLVILDYHQLFTDNDYTKGATERNMNFSRQTKGLATSNNIPIIDITAATMDDISDTKKPPKLSQVAWSKAIEFDADMAMAVHLGDEKDIVEVVSEKNRWGPDFAFFLDVDLSRGIMKERYDEI